MQTSKIVEIDGIFIGAAVLLPDAQGWRFVAADDRAGEADGQTAPTLHDAQQLAKRAFFSARSPKMTQHVREEAAPQDAIVDSTVATTGLSWPVPPAAAVPARA